MIILIKDLCETQYYFSIKRIDFMSLIIKDQTNLEMQNSCAQKEID